MGGVNDATTRRLERAVWVMATAVIAAGWVISYSSLRLLAVKVGHYGAAEALLYPLPIDCTLGGAVAAEFLLARWDAPLRARLYVGGQILVSAAGTVTGNALHGLITEPSVVQPWWGAVAVSAVPGAAIAGMTHAATLMLRYRSRSARVVEEGTLTTAERPTDARSVARPARPLLPARTTRPGTGGTARRPAAEVLEMVRSARQRLTAERGKVPSDDDIAGRVTEDGHPLSASRARTYLAQIRTLEGEGRPTEARDLHIFPIGSEGHG